MPAFISISAISFSVWLLCLGLYKILHFSYFASAIRSHMLIHDNLITLVAFFVSFAEVLISILSLLWTLASAPHRSLLLMSAFFLTMAGYALTLIIYPPPSPAMCGCGFGTQPVVEWSGVAMRNGLIASALVCLAFFGMRRSDASGYPRRLHSD